MDEFVNQMVENVGIDKATAEKVVAFLKDHAGDVVCAWLPPDTLLVRSLASPVRVRRAGAAAGDVEIEVAPPPVGLKAVDSFVVSPDGATYAYSYGQELSQLYLATL